MKTFDGSNQLNRTEKKEASCVFYSSRGRLRTQNCDKESRAHFIKALRFSVAR